MVGFALILFPFVLLGFVLLMGRVEDPMNEIAVEQQLEDFLEHANPGELDAFVREGTEPALRRFRRRLSPRRFGIGRRRSRP